MRYARLVHVALSEGSTCSLFRYGDFVSSNYSIGFGDFYGYPMLEPLWLRTGARTCCL